MQINQRTSRMSDAASFAWLTHIILRLHGQHQPLSLRAGYGETVYASLVNISEQWHSRGGSSGVLGEKAEESRSYALLACNNIPYTGIALQDFWRTFVFHTDFIITPHEIISPHVFIWHVLLSTWCYSLLPSSGITALIQVSTKLTLLMEHLRKTKRWFNLPTASKWVTGLQE